MYEKHRGGVLGPPSDPEALERMGPLVPALDVSLADAAELSPSGVQPAPTYKTLLKKRKELARTSVADVALGGLGWLAVTPVAVDGSNMKRDAVQQGRVSRRWLAATAVGVSRVLSRRSCACGRRVGSVHWCGCRCCPTRRTGRRRRTGSASSGLGAEYSRQYSQSLRRKHRAVPREIAVELQAQAQRRRRALQCVNQQV